MPRVGMSFRRGPSCQAVIIIGVLITFLLQALLSSTTGSTAFMPSTRLFHGALSTASAVVIAGSAILGPSAAIAESVDPLAKSLEDKIRLRDEGLKSIADERKKPVTTGKRLKELQKQEEKLVQEVETLRVQLIERTEKAQKETIDAAERRAKAQIDKEERAAKDVIETELAAKLAQISATEKVEIAEVKKVEQSKKREVGDTLKKEKRAAKNEAQRDAAEDKASAAREAIEDQAEADIIAITQRSQEALRLAVLDAGNAKEAAVERAEFLRKGVGERAETSRREAAESAEKAEKEALTEEEQAERLLAETIEELEIESLEAGSANLAALREFVVVAANIAAPLVLPGVFLLCYAVLASFFAPPPEPAKGGEADDVRVKMGRKPRGDKGAAKLDPWLIRADGDAGDASGKAGKNSKVPVGAATAGVAFVAMHLLPTGTPAFSIAKGSEAARALHTVAAHKVISRAKPATVPRGSSVSRGTAALLASGAVVALSSHRVGGRRMIAPRGGSRGIVNVAHGIACRAVKDEITEENPLRVIVAGAGVGGLLLAKALSKIPTIKLTVLEQTDVFARFGGPIQLASNALSVIRSVDEQLFNDLMEKFTFTGCRKNGLVDALRTEWYCPFDAMKTAADGFELPYTGVVDRPDLQQLLLDSVPEEAIYYARRLESYEVLPNGEGVKAFTVGGEEWEGDVLIGADGIWSATRAQMWNEKQKGPGSGCTYSGYIVFAGETTYQPEDYFDVGYKVYMGPGRYFVCSDVGRGRIQWYAFCGVPENQEIPQEPDAKKAYVTSFFGGWSTQISELVEATPAAGIEDRALYDRPPSVFRSWAEGPVAIMGDACHPMMPNLGQGGCQAMEDAYKIMENLRDCRRRSDVPEVLQDYYRSRLVRSAVVQGLSRLASDLLLSTFTFPWKPSEGFSSPYGRGKGDFQYGSVLVNYLRYLLPTIFDVQFGYLYSYHPHKWTKKEVDALVDEVMTRHREDAEAAWKKRMDAVERGDAIEDEVKESFFKVAARTPVKS